MKSSEKQMDVQKIFPLVITILMCLAIHGYRFSNNMFSHDALLDVVQNDAAWEVALGRFFQPICWSMFCRSGKNPQLRLWREWW